MMSGWTGAVTFAKTWARSVAARPEQPFLVFESPDGTVTGWTYSEFDEGVGRVAALLVSYGLEPGAAVSLALTNSPTFIAVWLAANRLGAWIVPSDPMGRTPEFADHISRTRPVVGFCSTERADVYRPAAGDVPVVEVDEADTELTPFPDFGFVDWPEPGLRDRAAVMFTSGTTGRPKGVEVTQANYAFAGKIMAEAAALTPEDRQLVVLPLFHANAQYYSFASAIWTGSGVALMSTFSASGFLPQAARHGATCTSLFAAPMRMILARGGPTEGVRLRHCWYAQNISDDQYETVSSWLGCRPRQLYGMTETIPAVLTDEVEDPRADSMGYVTPGCVVDVQAPNGGSVAPGDIGEVVVGGDRSITLFAGYLDDRETTEASFRHGWFRTGDRAIRDVDGRHYFHGRSSDILKVAGENVSTVEVEGTLSAHPRVLEAAVVGAPDDIQDEIPVAFVVVADPMSPPTREDLHAWCADRLAKSKRPREIILIDELPRTSVGKIRKFVLADEARRETSNGGVPS